MGYVGLLAIAVSTVAIIALISTIPPVEADTPFIGEIGYFPYNFAPRGWAFCNGTLLPIADNTALFAILGTTFGGDGETTFGLPELRGRVIVHPGSGPGLQPISLGQKIGTNNFQISINNLPSHNHGLGNAILQGVPVVGDSVALTGNGLGLSFAKTYSTTAPNTALHAESIAGTTDNVGQNQQISNMQPSLGVNSIIALVGTFPSRN